MKNTIIICVIALLFASIGSAKALDLIDYSKNNPLYFAYTKINSNTSISGAIRIVEELDDELSSELFTEYDNKGELFWFWFKEAGVDDIIVPSSFLTVKYRIKKGKKVIHGIDYLYFDTKLLIMDKKEF